MTNTKLIYVLITSGIFFLILIIFYSYSHKAVISAPTVSPCEQSVTKLQEKLITITTNNNNIIFTVEIADTNNSRQIGLMCRKTLKDEKGMLFIFDDSQIRSFWMKNTLIPLDIIFIDKDFNIINIYHNTTPLLENIFYTSDSPAKYVLEVNGGVAETYNYDSSSRLIIN